MKVHVQVHGEGTHERLSNYPHRIELIVAQVAGIISAIDRG
jgi:hypothetical protein